MNERILFSALSSRTARLANGSKFPDMDFAQVLAGRNRVLNSANPENKPAENLDISTLLPPVINCIAAVYQTLQYCCAQAVCETQVVSVCRLSVFCPHLSILKNMNHYE